MQSSDYLPLSKHKELISCPCSKLSSVNTLVDKGVLWRYRGTVQEVDEILTKARMFQYKPDGDVTFMTFQDAHGMPITTFQDPLHYPHKY